MLLIALSPQYCKHHPRNKMWNKNWMAESSNYAYGLSTPYACRDNQRQFKIAPGTNFTSARPGQKLNMAYFGNGHTREDVGSPADRNPGLVRIYWAGKPETEIVYAKDLTEKYWIPGAQQNFSADTITWLDNKEHPTKMKEYYNYFEFTVPEKIQNGRHMMVWAWAWSKSMLSDGSYGDSDMMKYDDGWDNAWTTCFDLEIVGSDFHDAASPIILANHKGYNSEKAASSTANDICSKTCFQGAQKSAPCTGKNCPPCWYEQDSQINCYQYTAGQTCPWNNAFDCKTGQKATTYKRDNHHHRRHHA